MKTLILFLIAVAGSLAALLGLNRLDAWLEKKYRHLVISWTLPLAAAPRRSPAHRTFPLVLCAALFSSLSALGGECRGEVAFTLHDSRFTALSMLESGDRDTAIGRAGEVSRYQITPRLWREYTFIPGSRRRGNEAGSCLDPVNPFTALAVAIAIQRDRCAAFATRFHRPCTDQEFYLLWARPATLLVGRVTPCAPLVRDRSQRFANLVNTLTAKNP